MRESYNILNKLKRKVRAEIITFFRSKSFYPKIYASYWHYRFYRNNSGNQINYFTAVPNCGAGIGHQMSNWITGYWYARQLGLKFTHIPFSTKKWENFLGFGEDETSIETLLQKGYKKVRLPLFDELIPNEFDLTKKIIQTYSRQKVVFVAEQDQFYREQCGVIEDIQRKFYSAAARKDDKIIFSSTNFNIAIHIRRGDIVVGQENLNPNLQIRWQDNNYFRNVLEGVLSNLQTSKTIAIYLFSQGEAKDFPEFESFKNLFFCLDMNSQDSFLHMVNADILITSKSSFSYKPALLSKGIKICPADFWHSYPATSDWILMENNGSIKVKN